MAIKKVFVDDEGNEMQCFINTHNRIVLTSGVPENSEFYPYYAGLICLTKEDAEILISELRILIDEM